MEDLPVSWSACSGRHPSVEVYGGQIREKEKWSSMKIDGTGNWRLERSSLPGVASPATWGHGEVPAQAASEVSKSMARVCVNICDSYYHKRTWNVPGQGSCRGPLACPRAVQNLLRPSLALVLW